MNSLTQFVTQAALAGPGPAREDPAGLAAAALALLALVTATLLLKTAFVAVALWVSVSRPEFSSRARRLYRERPGGSFLAGLVNVLLGLFVGVVLLSIKPLAFIGLALLLLLFALLVIGRAPIYSRLGERLAAGASVPRQLTAGGATAELAFLIPVLGQLSALFLVLRGAGAVVLALLGKGAAPEEPVPQDDQSPPSM